MGRWPQWIQCSITEDVTVDKARPATPECVFSETPLLPTTYVDQHPARSWQLNHRHVLILFILFLKGDHRCPPWSSGCHLRYQLPQSQQETLSPLYQLMLCLPSSPQLLSVKKSYSKNRHGTSQSKSYSQPSQPSQPSQLSQHLTALTALIAQEPPMWSSDRQNRTCVGTEFSVLSTTS